MADQNDDFTAGPPLPGMKPAPAGQSDTADTQGEPGLSADLSRGPTLSTDIQATNVDMAGPGIGQTAKSEPGDFAREDEVKPAGPQPTDGVEPANAKPATQDNPFTDGAANVSTSVTDGLITEGTAASTTQATGGPAGDGTTMSVSTGSGSGSGTFSSGDSGTQSEPEVEKVKAADKEWDPESNTPPPETKNRIKEGSQTLEQAFQIAESLNNPNDSEMDTIGKLRYAAAEIEEARRDGYNIDASVIQIGFGNPDIEIQNQIEAQKKAQEAQAELERQEAEKRAKEAQELQEGVMTQALIAAEDWTQSLDGVGKPIREVHGGAGAGGLVGALHKVMVGPGESPSVPDTHFIKTDNPIHPNNIPKLSLSKESMGELFSAASMFLSLSQPGFSQTQSRGESVQPAAAGGQGQGTQVAV